MKILKSKKGIPIPTLFFISDRKEIKDVPKGVPYFYGSPSTEEYIITILEYEVLYQKAISSGYPFNFKKILTEAGYKGIDTHEDDTVRTNLGTDRTSSDMKDNKLIEQKTAFKNYITSGNVYVDISLIKSLNIFPVWMETLEDAISTNIHNFATFDNNLYNKKLEGMYGGMVLNSPKKNLIIIDISSSIPREVSSTCLVLAQNLSEAFYADIMITGSITTLYEYERIQELNIETIYEENGMNNDQIFFKNLLTGSERKYDTLIVFGDGDSPNHDWYNQNKSFYKHVTERPVRLTDEKGKKLNKWQVNNIISFHTTNTTYNKKNWGWREEIAAYGRWFETENVTHIENWVVDLKE